MENGMCSEGETQKLKVLFLCTANACRSQMAEGWTRHLKSRWIDCWSAGVRPYFVDRLAIEVMAEAGVDISHHQSKHVDTLDHLEFDYVITLCGNARQSCPVFPARIKVVHMGFDDPPRLAIGSGTKEKILVHYRRVRDDIREFIEKLPQWLTEKNHSS